MNFIDYFMTFIGLGHTHCSIPETRQDENVLAAGQRNAVAFREMNRTTMRSIMASSESEAAVHGVLQRLERQKGKPS
jgi:hypothetical protein